MFVMLRISSWMPSSFQRTVHVLTYIDCFARFVLKKKANTSVSFSPLLMYIFRASSSSIHLFLCTQWTSGFSVFERSMLIIKRERARRRRRRSVDVEDPFYLSLSLSCDHFVFLAAQLVQCSPLIYPCVCVCVCDCIYSYSRLFLVIDQNQQNPTWCYLSLCWCVFLVSVVLHIIKKMRKISETVSPLPSRRTFVVFIFLPVFNLKNYWWISIQSSLLMVDISLLSWTCCFPSSFHVFVCLCVWGYLMIWT